MSVRTCIGGGILAALLILANTSAARADDALALSKILTGSFSSAAQASADPGQPVETLRITPVWAHRTDGPWLYVERAPAEAPGEPSRQEIWQLKFQPHKGGTEIRPYRLPDPQAVVGAWREPDMLRTVVPEMLTRVTGCEVVLQRRREFEFSGGTPGMDCVLPGSDAAYHLIQSTVAAEGMTWWERAFDAGGQRIGGPESEGVRFDKVAIGDVPVTP